MGRGRAPCCEKVGLNKGAWTPEEDMRLVAYIKKYGHANWRALPKQAGLLRCGKSCRLRWINYLRPDIKRGNFSREEEETIYKLHDLLGNKWSLIASRLPGRTDNEIKNVWNTHLKKRLAATTKEQKPPATTDGESPGSPSSSNSTSVSDHGDHQDKCDDIEPMNTDSANAATTLIAAQVALAQDPGGGDQDLVEEATTSEEKIEIPVEEPNLDMWGMLDDPVLLQPPQLTNLEDDDNSELIPSMFPNSSYDVCSKQEDPLNEILELPVLSEMLELMEDDDDSCLVINTTTCSEKDHNIEKKNTSTTTPNLELQEDSTSAYHHQHQHHESREWLTYLEKELDLWDRDQDKLMVGGAHVGLMECDPISSSYFHKGPTSPSPVLDLLDFNCLSAMS